jgi:uncharacterized protein (DUF302 family)
LRYDITKSTDLTFENAVLKVTDELKKEGFGILTSIDVKETMKKKLNLDFPKYTILGACNPPFAYEVLEAKKDIGLFLPCNVIVYEEGEKITVAAFNPMVVTEMVSNSVVNSVAVEMKARLEKVIAAV